MARKTQPPLDRIIDRDSVALSTLASATALIVGTLVNTQNFSPAAWQGSAGVNAMTVAQGPLLWGFANAELSLAEIQEYLDLSGPLNKAAVPEFERSSRSVQLMGSLSQELPYDWHQMTPIRTPKLREDIGRSSWVYNLGGGALTTGAVFSVGGVTFGRWID